MTRRAIAARVLLSGRDHTAPVYRSPRADRFEPTTLGKLHELYRSPREPLWKSVLACVVVAAVAVTAVLL